LGCVFGGVILVIGAEPHRTQNAALVLVLLAAIGALFMLYFLGTTLIAQGVAKRHVYGMWAAVAILPAILVSINLTWGALFFAVLVPALLVAFWRPRHP
jgi:hypothetical protein